MSEPDTDLVSQSHWVPLLSAYKGKPWRLVAFETWPDKRFDNCDLFLSIYTNAITLAMLSQH